MFLMKVDSLAPLSVSIWLALLLLRKNMQVSSSWGCKIVYPREWEISSRGLKFSLVTIGILITILKKIFLLRWGDISCFVILLYSWNFSLLRSCSHHVWLHGLRWSMWGLKPSQKMGNCSPLVTQWVVCCYTPCSQDVVSLLIHHKRLI